MPIYVAVPLLFIALVLAVGAASVGIWLVRIWTEGHDPEALFVGSMLLGCAAFVGSLIWWLISEL